MNFEYLAYKEIPYRYIMEVCIEGGDGTLPDLSETAKECVNNYHYIYKGKIPNIRRFIEKDAVADFDPTKTTIMLAQLGLGEHRSRIGKTSESADDVEVTYESLAYGQDGIIDEDAKESVTTEKGKFKTMEEILADYEGMQNLKRYVYNLFYGAMTYSKARQVNKPLKEQKVLTDEESGKQTYISDFVDTYGDVSYESFNREYDKYKVLQLLYLMYTGSRPIKEFPLGYYLQCLTCKPSEDQTTFWYSIENRPDKNAISHLLFSEEDNYTLTTECKRNNDTMRRNSYVARHNSDLINYHLKRPTGDYRNNDELYIEYITFALNKIFFRLLEEINGSELDLRDMINNGQYASNVAALGNEFFERIGNLMNFPLRMKLCDTLYLIVPSKGAAFSFQEIPVDPETPYQKWYNKMGDIMHHNLLRQFPESTEEQRERTIQDIFLKSEIYKYLTENVNLVKSLIVSQIEYAKTHQIDSEPSMANTAKYVYEMTLWATGHPPVGEWAFVNNAERIYERFYQGEKGFVYSANPNLNKNKLVIEQFPLLMYFGGANVEFSAGVTRFVVTQEGVVCKISYNPRNLDITYFGIASIVPFACQLMVNYNSDVETEYEKGSIDWFENELTLLWKGDGFCEFQTIIDKT